MCDWEGCTTGTIGLPNPNQRSVAKTSRFLHPYIYRYTARSGCSGERFSALEGEGITWMGQPSRQGIAPFSVRIEFWRRTGQLTNGAFIVWRITAKKRMVAKLKAMKAELQRRKHHRTSDVGAWLRKVVLGYYQYHAVPGNSTQLRIFSRRVCWLWRSVLIRRSQRAQVRWARLSPLLTRWIPQPRILHPYPDARFAATHPG
jgi:hypothetical protein